MWDYVHRLKILLQCARLRSAPVNSFWWVMQSIQNHFRNLISFVQNSSYLQSFWTTSNASSHRFDFLKPLIPWHFWAVFTTLRELSINLSNWHQKTVICVSKDSKCRWLFTDWIFSHFIFQKSEKSPAEKHFSSRGQRVKSLVW